MDPIAWAIILLCLGLALTTLEFFVPSGGILGLLSVVALIAAIWMAFKHGSWTGLAFVALVIMGVPVVLSMAIRVWPHTAMGRRLLLNVPTGEEVMPDTDIRRTLKSLVGKVGVAKSLMMPSGAVQIEGNTIDAVSEGEAIEPGQPVRVVEVRGTRVVVSPSRQQPPLAKSDDPLSQPIDSLGLDPFEDPLA
jgi:membrane-bound serine protease (ClpP class)